MSASAQSAKQPTVVREVSQGRLYRLEDRPLALGGEAWIYAVQGDPGLVAKVYRSRHQESPQMFAQRRLEAAEKLAVMLKSPPRNPTAAHRHESYAWPSALISGPDDNSVLGFLMPRMRGMREVFDFYNPGQRRQYCPYFDYRYLHQAARNIAGIMREIHSKGYVIGDVNQKNILVSDSALVTIIDTDSFQITDPATGHVFLCRVRTDGFIPPEAYSGRQVDVMRTVEQDLFGLAVVVFHLLMEGVHPFSGRDPSSVGIRTLQDRIICGDFPYAPGSRVQPMATAPPFEALHRELRLLFIRSFVDGHGDPRTRPDAKEWQHGLDKAVQDLRSCRRNQQHVYAGHLGESCPWCARVDRGLHDTFPSRGATGLAGTAKQAPTQQQTPRVQPGHVQQQAPRPSQTQAPQQARTAPVKRGFAWGKAVLFAVVVIIVIRVIAAIMK